MEKHSSNCSFILAVNSLFKIVEAIISRCQVFQFKRLNDEEVTIVINRILEEESQNITQGKLAIIIKQSNGDLRKAITILETEILGSAQLTDKKSKVQIKKILQLVLGGHARTARKLIYPYLDTMNERDFIILLHDEIIKANEKYDDLVSDLLISLAEYDYRMSVGGEKCVQLDALLAEMSLKAITWNMSQIPKKEE